MIAVLTKGFVTGAALIIAIGSQNAFILRQGLRREHVFVLVAFCALSDATLIFAGIGGAAALIRGNAQLLEITRYGGALFLGGYGGMAARRAWAGGHMHLQPLSGISLKSALATCFAFTFLNPHVYLDTVVVLGSVANQQGPDARWWFGAGAALASVVWFASLGYGARLLAPWFEKDGAWRVLDSLIAVVMLLLTASLLLG